MLPLDPDKFPPELKARPQWVCWSFEEREGKPTKVPKNPKSGGNARADDPDTWGEFDQAVRHWAAHKGNGIAGVGFEFSPEDPFTGVDLDKCRNSETEEIDPKALGIVRRLNSYTEVSPSGTGLHIWIKGVLPPGARRKGKIEMYDTGRYFTVTGAHLEGTPTTIEPRQAELEALHGEVFGKPKGEPPAAASTSTGGGADIGSGLSDADLIERIRNSKNGKKFDRLMTSSDLEEIQMLYLLPSQSEVDLSLCSILAFWTRKDATQMDSIFRRSALMRPKWDDIRSGQTYGQWTIAKAITGTTEVWRGGKRRKSKPAQARPPEPDSESAGETSPFSRTPYFIQDGSFYFRKDTQQGVVKVRLTNFTAECKEELVKDDGVTRSIEFSMGGALDSGKPLPPVLVKSGEFTGMAWVNKCWGLAPSITAGQSSRDHTRAAIQHLSKNAQRRTVFSHTGWRKVNGIFRYLHGSGALGPGDPLEVDLGDNLHLYGLPSPGGLEAAQASLRFLDIAAWEVTAPLLACCSLAPFADLLKIDFSLWLFGPTGSMKSTVAALALSHFGIFNRKTLPGSWFSTANSLEKMSFTLKDTLLVIDDFMPASNAKESHRMAETAARLIYQAGNRSGRGRLTSDLTARPNHYPRCLIISTGELLLPGQRQSATARYLGIELDPKRTPIDLARLTAAQGEAHLYAGAMAAYLENLAPRLEEVQEEMQALFEAYRGAFQTGGHARVPEIQAWLTVGLEMFLRFQTSMGAISESQANEMLNRAWKVFEALGEKHSRNIEGERPTLKFMAVLQELFLQGRIYAESSTTPGYAPPRGFGWDDIQPAYNAELVGWVDGEMLYLMPETALRVVHEAIRRQGDFLALGRNDMLAALAREGFIMPGKDSQKGRNTHIKKIQGSAKRVICLPINKLSHEEDENL